MTQSGGLRHTVSTLHFILRGITSQAEELEFLDADKAGLVSELAHDPLLVFEIEKMGGGSDREVTQSRVAHEMVCPTGKPAVINAVGRSRCLLALRRELLGQDLG